MISIQRFTKIVKSYWYWLLAPFALTALCYMLLQQKADVYKSEALLYTGIMSGIDIESLSDRKDYSQINANFNNLITIASSKETHLQVAVDVLAHSLSDGYAFLSDDTKSMLIESLSDSIFVKMEGHDPKMYIRNELAANDEAFTELLYKSQSPWSVKSISEIKSIRIPSSDLINLSYESSDQHLSKYTLDATIEVFSEKYTNMKKAEAQQALEYFEQKLVDVTQKLNTIDNNLAEFKSGNKIIDYDEQSKFMANQTEELRAKIAEQRTRLQGARNSLVQLQSKIDISQQKYEMNFDLNAKRKKINQLSEDLVVAEINKNDIKRKRLQSEIDALQMQINSDVSQIYQARQEAGGVSSEQLVEMWLENTMIESDAQAKLNVYQQELLNLENKSTDLAPMGSELDKLKRQKELAESEYREVVNNLNQAKVRAQKMNLINGITVVDAPKIPLEPNDTKIIILTVLVFLITFGAVLSIMALVALSSKKMFNQQEVEDVLGIEVLYNFNVKNFNRGFRLLDSFLNMNVPSMCNFVYLNGDNNRITGFIDKTNESNRFPQISLIRWNSIHQMIENDYTGMVILCINLNKNVSEDKIKLAKMLAKKHGDSIKVLLFDK